MPASPEHIDAALRELALTDCDAWIDLHKIVNEKGERVEWTRHAFQIDIYNDQSDQLVVMKAAQVGLSTLEVIKMFRDAEARKMDIVYTLPTDEDVKIFVGGKVNRIIANNPHLLSLTKDKDSVEQKAVGKSIVYFRGTWTKGKAIMISADRLVHDEVDSSKQDVVADYQSRMGHSEFKQIHVFSHPSAPGTGADVSWMASDQKEWFVTCPHCGFEQFLSWDLDRPERMSVDIERREFVCKGCRGALSDADRAVGRWVARFDRAKHPEIRWSGYHVSLLMAPWIDASHICDKWQQVVDGHQTEAFFYNKVLGLPFSGGGNSVSEDTIKGAWVPERSLSGRLVVGVDTGIRLRYVAGDSSGLVGYGEMKDYMPDATNGLELRETLEYFLTQFPDSVMVIDAGGDITAPRKLREKYPGRVFLCHYARDRKTMQLVRWGEKDESGVVVADRNRMIEIVIGDLRDRRATISGGTREDWHGYWLHWSHIFRTERENALGVVERVWARSDRDDFVHATVYWRVGVSRFGGAGGISLPSPAGRPDSYVVDPNQTVTFDPASILSPRQSVPEDPFWVRADGDWRDP